MLAWEKSNTSFKKKTKERNILGLVCLCLQCHLHLGILVSSERLEISRRLQGLRRALWNLGRMEHLAEGWNIGGLRPRCSYDSLEVLGAVAQDRGREAGLFG